MSTVTASRARQRFRSPGVTSASTLLVSALIIGVIMVVADRPRWPTLMARGLGHLTFVLLAVVLLSSPLARLHPRSRVAKLVLWRKPLGIALLVPAVLHFAFVIWSTPDLRRFEIHPTTDLPGALALLCLLTLGATTPDRVKRRLGHARWKRLQRSLIVLAFAFTAPAALAAEFWPLGVTSFALIVTALVYRWRYYKALGLISKTPQADET